MAEVAPSFWPDAEAGVDARLEAIRVAPVDSPAPVADPPRTCGALSSGATDEVDPSGSEEAGSDPVPESDRGSSSGSLSVGPSFCDIKSELDSEPF